MSEQHQYLKQETSSYSINLDGLLINDEDLNTYYDDMSKEKLIEAIHKENLCTYFVLPLLKLNKLRFVAETNFIDSYLSRDCLNIYVKVVDTKFFEHRMVMHPQYQGIWEDMEGKKYVQYSIPLKWKADIQLFIEGKFSKMSESAKEMIRINSGLLFRERRESDNMIITDVRLLALERSIAVRQMWEDHYGVTLSDDQELLSIPKDRGFIENIPLVLCKQVS